MAGLIEGLKVIDLSWGMPGPISSMILADNGADVIKVEPPGGDPFRFYKPYHVWNRGKRSVTADLKTAEGKAFLFDLLADADIMIESFQPGGMEKLGLGDLDARFPRLIHVSITGYGPDHPRRDEPGYEALVDAWLGLHNEQPGKRPGPRYISFPIASYGTAFMATVGALAALRARGIEGRGQRVDTTMVDGAVALSNMSWFWSEKHCDKSKSKPLDGQLRMRHLMLLGAMKCGDGQYIQFHSGPAGRFQKGLDILGLGDKVSYAEPTREKATPLTPEEKTFLEINIRKVLQTKPRAHWIEQFEAADICTMPVDPPGVAFSDPQIVHDQVVIGLDDPELGPIKVVGPVLKCADAPPRVRGPAPRAGEHAEAVKAELRARKSVPAQARPAGKPLRHALEGIRILDFGAYFAGPYAAKLLGDLGAEVIKIEPLIGDPMRGVEGPLRMAQRGKRSIALDMKSPKAQEIAHRLIARADIVGHNMRPGAAERLGIGFEAARKSKPDIVYLHSPGFGRVGPRAHQQAFATMISAMCGYYMQAAGKGNEPVQSLANEDYLNGCLGAIAMLMGLNYRDRTGKPILLESSLLASTLFCASEVILKPDGSQLFGYDIDADQMGLGPLCRLYRTGGDGWACLVVALEHEWRALTKVPGLEGLAGDARFSTREGREANGAALAQVLEAWFAGRPAAAAVAALKAAGVPAEQEMPSQTDSFFNDAFNIRSGRVAEYQNPRFGLMREQGNPVRLSRLPGNIRGGVPLLGDSSRAILNELGYSAAEVAALEAEGVVTGPEAMAARQKKAG